MSWKPYDNTGLEYEVHRILNQDGTFNIGQYKTYSPLFLSSVLPFRRPSWLSITPTSSTSFAIAYGLSFASITATIVHSILYFWKPIRVHLRRSLREQPDIHAKLMSNYRQVPEWWYAILFAINFVFACISVQLWPTHLPIWALMIGLSIGKQWCPRLVSETNSPPSHCLYCPYRLGRRYINLVFLTLF